MTGPMDESNEAIEARMGMSLESARDMTALSYLNVYLRLMARELNVPNVTNDALVGMAEEMVTALNSATTIGWCAIVGDRQMAEEALDKLRAIVEGIPR